MSLTPCIVHFAPLVCAILQVLLITAIIWTISCLKNVIYFHRPDEAELFEKSAQNAYASFRDKAAMSRSMSVRIVLRY